MNALSRRGLLGFALAAPAIIRTPGLLMRIRPARLTIVPQLSSNLEFFSLTKHGPLFVSGDTVLEGVVVRAIEAFPEFLPVWPRGYGALSPARQSAATLWGMK